MAMNSQTEDTVADEDGVAEAESDRLNLGVEITDVGPCRKHVNITVPQADIERIRDDAVEELAEKAQVPGFRVGKAPRSLLLKRFKEEISSDIKQKVLMASLDQLSDDSSIQPITEPTLDVESLSIPDSGDFCYEFEVEVRPDFALPDYGSLTINMASGEITDEELTAHKTQYLASFGSREPSTEPAAEGDFVSCSMRFTHEGKEIREVDNTSLQLKESVQFQDASLDGFAELMAGTVAGDERQAKVTISMQTPVVEMRGEEVEVHITVNEVQKLVLPTLDGEFLERFGCETPDELDEQLRAAMERQIEYQQRQSAREQILTQIIEASDWDLPESLVRKQTENALRREILEMTQAGFTREQIVARENELRQNALEGTRQALKEHFVLDRVATEEEIECTPGDIEAEMLMMSFQSGESVRRIRARLTKNGMIENLEAQLRERKAVDFLIDKATVKQVEREPMARASVTAARFAICGNMDASLIDDEDEAGDGESDD
jgi:trigger factor